MPTTRVAIRHQVVVTLPQNACARRVCTLSHVKWQMLCWQDTTHSTRGVTMHESNIDSYAHDTCIELHVLEQCSPPPYFYVVQNTLWRFEQPLVAATLTGDEN